MANEPYLKIYALPTPAGILRLIGQKGPVELQMDDCTGENAPLAHAFDLYIPLATLEAGASYTLQFSDAYQLDYEPTKFGGRYTSTVNDTLFGTSIVDHAKRHGGYSLFDESADYQLVWDKPRKGEVTICVNSLANPDSTIMISVAWGDTSSVAKTRLDNFIGAREKKPWEKD